MVPFYVCSIAVFVKGVVVRVRVPVRGGIVIIVRTPYSNNRIVPPQRGSASS